MAIAALVELAVIMAIVVYARPQYFGGVGTLGARVEQKVANSIATGLDTLGVSAGTPVPPGTLAEAPHAPDRPPAAARTRPAPSAATANGEGPRVGGQAVVPTAASPAPAGGGAPVVPSFEPDSTAVVVAPLAAALAASPDLVWLPGPTPYSSADLDVEPPRLSRDQLPKQPEAGDDTGYFDLIVSERGDVERVVLISPMNRYAERMLVAAAKAWTFRPATRNGKPVRYRMQIPIILRERL
jgi:hypothetical protein